MPTQHVEPDGGDLLQDVADTLLKARKVVVVTGAGISTNSGIPDFRSENGLYALIQAQFDAAARLSRETEPSPALSDGSVSESDEGPPSKRRKISRQDTPEAEIHVAMVKEEAEVQIDAPGAPEEGDVVKTAVVSSAETIVTSNTDTAVSSLDANVVSLTDPVASPTDPDATDDAVQTLITVCTPKPRHRTASGQLASSSPLSSPPPEAFANPPSVFRRPAHSRLADITIPLSSSPLSSPPPILFDPFLPSSPSDDSSSRRSSTSPSEVEDDAPSSNPFSASQTSLSGRSSLPNMKGKDLFDASIWADPLRTSVFYTFATTLRQKIRDVEPTDSHRFISHLRDRGKLVRCYTQNIDQIEEKVGLSTSLHEGPGSRGRFSRRSTANAGQLNKMVDEASGASGEPPATTESSSQPASDSSQQPSSQQPSSQQPTSTPSDGASTPAEGEAPAKATKPGLSRSGVECVFLHGSLDCLRCFLCGRLCSWDDDGRELETLSGQQPECPHCMGATAAREERGKRALGVGKLRPDIVLYGEEHPNSHLISPIVTHDLTLNPDMLLILGTSLRVHGLKVMVREFAKAVHTKGGKVVFVNFTKPPESSWGDIIDYWVQWDCDAWVADLQSRVPRLWQDPEPRRPRKKRESGGNSEDAVKVEAKPRPPAANPVALRDTKVTGAYWTARILDELHRITGTTPPPRRASIATVPSSLESTTDLGLNPLQRVSKAQKPRQPRKSAPGALERTKKASSTLNPNHGRSRRAREPAAPNPSPEQLLDNRGAISSILNSVKANPRVRKRKKIDGEEVVIPTVRKSRGSAKPNKADLELPPLRPQSQSPPQPPPLYGKPEPLEPRSPPAGPLASISVNLRSASAFGRKNAFYLEDPLLKAFDGARPWWMPLPHDMRPAQHKSRRQQHGGSTHAEANAAMTLAGLRGGEPEEATKPREMEGALMNWGASWNCKE